MFAQRGIRADESSPLSLILMGEGFFFFIFLEILNNTKTGAILGRQLNGSADWSHTLLP